MAVLLIAALVAAALWFRSRDKARRRAMAELEKSAEAGTPPATTAFEPPEDIEPNVGALGLALGAAVLAIVSVFLPALETTAFTTIAKNTLIQSGNGWLILGCAVGIIGAVYRVYSRRTRTWAVFVLGLVILGVAVYNGTGDRTKLGSVGSNPFESVVVNGSPAVGIYAAGAAGVLAMVAGLMLAGHVLDSYKGEERKTKVCPQCAETVLEAARVCKHCGHEFQQTTPADELDKLYDLKQQGALTDAEFEQAKSKLLE